MAKSSKGSAPPPGPPKLLISRIEAAEKIQSQISEGEELLAAQLSSQEALDQAREHRRIWSDYNRELLTQIFSTLAVADEYSAFGGGGVFLTRPSFPQLVSSHRDDVQKSLTRLKSILRRLDLMPAIDVGSSELPLSTRQPAGNSIFLVHGHNNEVKESVARFIEKLNLDVVILHEQPDKGRTIIEKFVDHSNVGYALILITADDVGARIDMQDSLRPRGRQNVILELGYFLGALGRKRVCALVEEDVEIPSDLSGVLFISLDPRGAWKLDLAKEIKASGIDVDLNCAI